VDRAIELATAAESLEELVVRDFALDQPEGVYHG